MFFLIHKLAINCRYFKFGRGGYTTKGKGFHESRTIWILYTAMEMLVGNGTQKKTTSRCDEGTHRTDRVQLKLLTVISLVQHLNESKIINELEWIRLHGQQ